MIAAPMIRSNNVHCLALSLSICDMATNVKTARPIAATMIVNLYLVDPSIVRTDPTKTINTRLTAMVNKLRSSMSVI